MSKPTVFISCGQYSEAEKRLGKQIAQMVKNLTGFEAFFAEDVQDLNGLDANILGALRDCVGFITVLHPRGDIKRPDGSVITRASVWIEQEVAVATYIQRVEKRELPIIAFKHVSVGREGIRDLLQLNPIPFTDESEILVALTERLAAWKSLTPSGIQLQLSTIKNCEHADHALRTLVVTLINDTSQRITEYDCEVRIPVGLLKHRDSKNLSEVRSDEPNRRRFRFDETLKGSAKPRVLSPHDQTTLMTFDYCTACALADCRDIPAVVADAVIDAIICVERREYSVSKTIKELAIDAESEESRAARAPRVER
jgi:hypothetical protein